MDGEKTEIRILYTNFRGETAVRRIRPDRIFFGSTAWHAETQWILEALDLDKGESRSFAMKDIHQWSDEVT